jgi:hypothetical protein
MPTTRATKKPAAPASTPELRGLEGLRQDPRNARRRTQRSSALLERSMSEFGAARSIVIDENGVVLAGNGTIEAAAAIGIEKVLVVPADGNTLVAVQRTDLSPAQKAEYGIADNRTSDLSEFDPDILTSLVEEHEDLTLSPWFTESELAALGGELEDPAGTDHDGDGDGKDPTDHGVQLQFADEEGKTLFLQTLAQLASELPQIPNTEQRIQFALDQFLAMRHQ